MQGLLLLLFDGLATLSFLVAIILGIRILLKHYEVNGEGRVESVQPCTGFDRELAIYLAVTTLAILLNGVRIYRRFLGE